MKTDILTNPSKEDLIKAIAINRSKKFIDSFESIKAGKVEDKSCDYYFTNVPHPMMNGIIYTKEGIEELEEIIMKGLSFFNEKHYHLFGLLILKYHQMAFINCYYQKDFLL